MKNNTVSFTEGLHKRLKRDYKESVLPIVETAERGVKAVKQHEQVTRSLGFITRHSEHILPNIFSGDKLKPISLFYIRCMTLVESRTPIRVDDLEKDFRNVSLVMEMLAEMTMTQFIQTFPPTKWVDKTESMKDYYTTMEAVEAYLSQVGIGYDDKMKNNEYFREFLLDYRSELIIDIMFKSIRTVSKLSEFNLGKSLGEMFMEHLEAKPTCNNVVPFPMKGGKVSE